MNDTKQHNFMRLYNPVRQNLERFALSISGSYDEAKEIVSETVFRAYQGFENIKEDKAFISYIFTIARRVRISLYNDNKRIIYYGDDLPDFMHAETMSPDDYAEISILYDAMNQLGDLEKEALILSEINDLPHKEIARIQEISIVNVKVRVHRAKQKMRRILSEVNVSETEESL